MKKSIIILFIFLLTGCSTNNTNCIYKTTDEDHNKTMIRVTLEEKKKIIVKENMYAEYIFNTETAAINNYAKIELIVEKDKTLNIKQQNNKIIVTGEKDIYSKKISKDIKIKEYEKIGYICK